MLHKDEWLSGFFPAGAYIYKAPFGGETLPRGFICAKVPAHDIGAARRLAAEGFYLVETLAHFRQNAIAPPAGGGDLISDAQPEDETAVGDIAAHAFTQSRLYRDDAISPALASDIKREWARNFFRGQRGDKMLVAREGGRAVGFNLLIGDVIDLIAVHPDYTRRGIAGALIAVANQTCGPLRAGTQITNAASLSLYRKAGFALDNASYVFHRHG